MVSYTSRIYIEVKNIHDWEKLQNLNAEQYGLWSEEFKERNEQFIYIDTWSCEEGFLFNLVQDVAMQIHDCIIFADTHDSTAMPYNYIIYYLGDRVKTKYVEDDLQDETSLTEPTEWFRRHKVKLDKNQKTHLESFNFD